MTFSLGIKFWVQSLFLPALWKCHSIISMFTQFQTRSLLLFLPLFLWMQHVFPLQTPHLLAAFNNVLFLFNFLHVEYDMSGYVFGGYLFHLVFSVLLVSVIWCLYFGKFIGFCLLKHYALFSFWDSGYICFRSFALVPQPLGAPNLSVTPLQFLTIF